MFSRALNLTVLKAELNSSLFSLSSRKYDHPHSIATIWNIHLLCLRRIWYREMYPLLRRKGQYQGDALYFLSDFQFYYTVFQSISVTIHFTMSLTPSCFNLLQICKYNASIKIITELTIKLGMTQYALSWCKQSILQLAGSYTEFIDYGRCQTCSET